MQENIEQGLDQWIQTLDGIRSASLSELGNALFNDEEKGLALTHQSDLAEEVIRNVLQLASMTSTLLILGLANETIDSAYEHVKDTLEYVAKMGYPLTPELHRVSEIYDESVEYRFPVNTIEGGTQLIRSTPKRVKDGKFLEWYVRARIQSAYYIQPTIDMLAKTGQIDKNLPGVNVATLPEIVSEEMLDEMVFYLEDLEDCN